MSKITSEHLARQAIIYVRQSTPDQVANNLESQRRQYGLTERARQLGWSEIKVIDDDLGRSGGGVARPGFEKLLAAICENRVGVVVSIEASRLARNGRDWHTLLEFCALVNTLIIDEDSVYDPRCPNDRLLLGMKGTMSEMELSMFRQRSVEARKQKARRGELFMIVAVGYVRIGRDQIDKDPDLRVQEAIGLVFRKFAEMQSVRQVYLWFKQELIPLPAIVQGPEGARIEWKLPVYASIRHILANPVYAGAYAFGRTGSQVTIKNGRKKIIEGLKKERKDWEVLIQEHHEGYVSWEDYERNQRLIADNANRKCFMSRGALRRGEALLTGLLRCGHCGRKLYVAYSGKGGNTGRYHCLGTSRNQGAERCIVFGGMRVDQEVGKEVIARLQPLGVEAAIAAMQDQFRETEDKLRQLDLALQQARYEAARAQRQYDAIDPDNRLVAAELERRWNERLTAARALEAQRDALKAAPATTLSAADRERLLALGADLERVWKSPGVTPAAKKRIVRTLVDEIIVRVEEEMLSLVIRWQGGDHSSLSVKKNRVGQHQWSTEADVIDLVRVLARQMPDKAVASLLNRAGKTTGRGNGWTKSRVCSLRHYNGIETYREGERLERGEVTLDEAAAALSISAATVRRLIKEGRLAAQQLCKGAPWVIRVDDLQKEDVKREAEARRQRRPPSHNPLQKELEL
jgi:excisionase family DNA binding protein